MGKVSLCYTPIKHVHSRTGVRWLRAVVTLVCALREQFLRYVQLLARLQFLHSGFPLVRLQHVAPLLIKVRLHHFRLWVSALRVFVELVGLHTRGVLRVAKDLRPHRIFVQCTRGCWGVSM